MPAASADRAAVLAAAFDPWPDEALEAIHEAALGVLVRAGVRVDSPTARELLLGSGCGEGPAGRVTVPRGAVEEALAACPPSFTLAARDLQRSLTIDSQPGPTFVHNMGTAADVADPRTGAHARATLADAVKLARVMHRLRNQHVLTSLVAASDVPAEIEPLYTYLLLANESDKYIGGPGISTAAQAEALLEMAPLLAGADGSDSIYPIDLAFSPVSPLILGGEVSDALIAAARHGGVVCEILPCPTAATTAPAAVSAAVAQQHAEVLSGVVLAQAAAPGTPVYYGPRLSAPDPRSGNVASGTPEISVVAAVLLARRCGLACDCYGLTSDSKVVDAQFGYERAVNALIGLLARPRFLSGIGELQGGAATCAQVLVIDDDILTNAMHAVSPRPWDAEALNVEAIVEGVLSGRGFLGSKHTRKYLHSEFPAPLVGYRGTLHDWLEAARTGVVEAAEERVAALLAEGPLGLPSDVGESLSAIVDTAAARVGLSEWPDPRRILADEVLSG
jgi:trimethylamine--corrinoid protein Co-methyltransferase